MNRMFSTTRVIPWALVVTTCLPSTSRAQGTVATWLDQPAPAAWNKAGASIPAAPPMTGETPNARCRELARPSESPEDRQVRDRGWDLVGAYQGGWQIRVVRGTAGYDGMCRPRSYQDFVFVRGVFAGTLSPQPMDSRTDGALNQVTLRNSTELVVTYARYAASDALCCPSRTTTVVFTVSSDPPIVAPKSASTTAG